MRILWLDCIGALVAGVVVNVLAQLLSAWEGLPLYVVVFMGVANLLYGSYSLYVAARRRRSMKLVTILAVANMTWFFVCLAMAATWWSQITGLGMLHVLGEGVYVGSLGYVEWRMKERLAV